MPAEPTSGLDARAAGAVMRAVSAVAHAHRTVICTIHQPNKPLFFAFTDVLLLQRGGWEVYCGPLGPRGADIRACVAALPGARPCPRGMNPASWMLDVLSGSDSGGHHHHCNDQQEAPTAAVGGAEKDGSAADSAAKPADADATAAAAATEAAAEAAAARRAGAGAGAIPGEAVAASFRSSPAWEALCAVVERHFSPPAGAEPARFGSVYSTPFLTQLALVTRRLNTSYSRNVGYNATRISLLAGLMTLFGTARGCSTLRPLDSPPHRLLCRSVPAHCCSLSTPSGPSSSFHAITRCCRLLHLLVLFSVRAQVYYNIKVEDEGGVASKLAVMFMSALFFGADCAAAVLLWRLLLSCCCCSAVADVLLLRLRCYCPPEVGPT